MENLLRFQNFDFKDKTVAIRLDLNLPYDPKTKKLSEGPRLKEHLGTLEALQKAGAKTVILAHQGRKGDEDFIPLKLHARLLEKHLGRKIKFLPFGADFKEISKMKSGEILVLDNVRFYEDETAKKTIKEHAKSALPTKLSPFLDYFVLDAFSVSHRAHASVVGFSELVPCIAGPVFLREFDFLTEFLGELKFSKSDVFVLGGAKPNEPLNMLENLFGRGIEKVLTTGIISLLLLKARGYSLGKTEEFLEKKGLLDQRKRLEKLAKEKNLLTPVDLAVERGGKRVEIGLEELPVKERILDIGEKTLQQYRKEIGRANIVCMKGPAGMYEKKGFEVGTKELFLAIRDAECISLIGGGNSTDAMEKLKISTKGFTYVSLSGGAFVEFLCGKNLPGIEGLQISRKRFCK